MTGYKQDEDVVISMKVSFALSRDLMVDLWLQSRQYNKMSPFKREVCGGEFVICDDGLYESFMEFKKGVIYQNDLRIVENVDLVTYWIKDLQININKRSLHR